MAEIKSLPLKSKVIGHKKQIQDLEHALEKNRLAPALLFLGPSGVGKKRVAMAIAQALVCESTPHVCGKCGPCIRVDKGSSESLLLISPQGTQIKTEQAKTIHEFLSLRSVSKNRVVVIDEAEKLNTQAANSLLKILEEPPADTYFIFIAENQNQMLSTIRSRVQIKRFGSLTTEELKSHFQGSTWALMSAQGQMGKLQSLLQPEFDELRRSVFHLFQGLQSQSFGWASQHIKDTFSDRETALTAIGLWQQFVRDLSFTNQHLEPVIHADKKNDLMSIRELSFSQIAEVSQLALQAEKDIHSNVDRLLVWENLWRKSQKAFLI